MDTPLMRLRLLLTPRGLLLLLVSGALGFLVIEAVGAYALAGFDQLEPQHRAFMGPIRDFYADRFDSRAWAWVGTAICFWWNFVGRQLRKAERVMGRYA